MSNLNPEKLQARQLLTKLNQFNGNYISAEMVKAFLSQQNTDTVRFVR